jgi:hypothetical protein
MRNYRFPIFAALACIANLMASPARAESVKIGSLECFIDAGSGFVVGSSKDVSCVLYSSTDEPLENYIGEIRKWGVDIGFTEEAFMEWAVYVPTGKSYVAGSLAGEFAGASASASLAIGLGASVLTGGQSRDIALQPVAIRKQGGVNVAIGIARLDLRLISSDR